ncbi:MAG TPA: hypothetical protein VLJ80_09175 [Solirubrobacteraceae bacterium]|nr:hypothetical protein [Solirubrobacteraceae bacterium]
MPLLLVVATVAGCGSGAAQGTSHQASAPATAATTQTPSSPATSPPQSASSSRTSPRSGKAKAPKSALESGVTARADAICVRRNRELAASALAAHPVIERRAIEQLHKLRPPRKRAREWNRVIALSEARLHPATKASDSQQFRLLAAASRADLKHCGALE